MAHFCAAQQGYFCLRRNNEFTYRCRGVGAWGAYEVDAVLRRWYTTARRSNGCAKAKVSLTLELLVEENGQVNFKGDPSNVDHPPSPPLKYMLMGKPFRRTHNSISYQYISYEYELTVYYTLYAVRYYYARTYFYPLFLVYTPPHRTARASITLQHQECIQHTVHGTHYTVYMPYNRRQRKQHLFYLNVGYQPAALRSAPSCHATPSFLSKGASMN